MTKFDGQNDEFDGNTAYNTQDFETLQALRAVSTATLVKVVKVSNTGTVDKIGTVDVLPLVNLMDAAGTTSKHVAVQSIPYMRSVGGSKGIIMDPKVGDVGIVVFADRDIQNVRKAKGQASPGSRRRFSMADGMYLSCAIADAPTSFLRFGDDGTIYISPDNGVTVVTVKAGDVTITPDSGTTLFEVKPNEIHAKAGLELWVRQSPLRIDLGKKDAPHAVMTIDGPSEKVFAVIAETP